MDDGATREAEQAVPATRKRKRSRAGCTGCRDFKKKCDEQQPCSRCAAAGRPCVYPPPRKGNIMRNKAHPLPQNAAPMVRLAVAAPPQSTPLDSVPSTSRSASISSSTSPSSISRGSHHPHMSVTCAGPETDDVELSENPIPCPLSEDFSGDLIQWISELTAQGRKTPSGTVVRSPGTASQALDSQESQQSLLESLIFDTGSTPSSFGQMPTETPLSQSNDVLGIPYDCEPSIWKEFVESSLWHGQPQEDSTARMHTSLMEYFKNFVAPTIVICRDTYGASETIYQPLAELVVQNNSNVLKQAILHLSAVHVSNFLFAFGNPDRAILFSTEAEKRRSMTLKALRVSAAQEDKDACVATAPVIMLLLTLSAFLRGDIDIVPTYLQQCSIYLARLADTFPTVNSMTSSYIAMEALFTIYSVFHALAQDRQKDLGTLFAAWTKTRSHPTWRRQWNGISESIIGISMDMLILLVQVQNLSYEHAVIVTALKRLPDDIELQLMALETKSNAQSLYGRLENHHIWESQFQRNFSERIKLGHEIYRLAARVCILSNIITDSPPARIAGTVAELVRLCTKISPGSEIGCCWPWVVIASESEEAQREKVLPFIRRCQWKGSANPRLAEKVVKEVWRRRDGAEEGASWRNVLAEMGSPVLL